MLLVVIAVVFLLCAASAPVWSVAVAAVAGVTIWLVWNWLKLWAVKRMEQR